jgi:hypothetical protein
MASRCRPPSVIGRGNEVVKRIQKFFAMADLSFEYNKKRREFSLPCQLSDSATTLLNSLDPSKKEANTWTERFATTIEFDTTTEVADVKVQGLAITVVVPPSTHPYALAALLAPVVCSLMFTWYFPICLAGRHAADRVTNQWDVAY